MIRYCRRNSANSDRADACLTKRGGFKLALANDKLASKRTAVKWNVKLRALFFGDRYFAPFAGLSRRRRPNARPWTITGLLLNGL